MPAARTEVVLADVTLARIRGGYLLSSVTRERQPMRLALDAAYLYLRSYAPGETCDCLSARALARLARKAAGSIRRRDPPYRPVAVGLVCMLAL